MRFFCKRIHKLKINHFLFFLFNCHNLFIIIFTFIILRFRRILRLFTFQQFPIFIFKIILSFLSFLFFLLTIWLIFHFHKHIHCILQFHNLFFSYLFVSLLFLFSQFIFINLILIINIYIHLTNTYRLLSLLSCFLFIKPSLFIHSLWSYELLFTNLKHLSHVYFINIPCC